MKPGDNILVRRLKDGDEIAFKEIYQRYKEKVYFFALRYVKNEAEASEILQQVFVKLWDSRHKIRRDKQLINYLFTITKNTLFHDLEKQKTRQAYIEYLKIYASAQSFATDEQILFDECRNALKEAIRELPAKRRQIFLSRKDHGMTYKAIAEQFHISIKTVETHISLATKSLREKMEEFL